MTARVLVDRSEGISEYAHFGADGDLVAVEREQDVEGVLEWCKGRFNEGLANAHCEFRQIASIPPNALEIWGAARGLKEPGWYLKKEYHDLVVEAAHDRDLSGFRTLPGNYMKRGG